MSSGACTPLYDAMGRTLTKLETQLAGDDNHSVVVRKNYQGVRSPSWGLWASVAAASAYLSGRVLSWPPPRMTPQPIRRSHMSRDFR